FAHEHPNPNANALKAQAEEEQRRIVDRWFNFTGTESIAGIRVEMTKTMEEGAGIFRNAESLQRTCATLKQLKERYRQVGISDKSLSFNTELTAALELGFLLDAAEAVAFSALARQESRGSHQRTDFPKRDDQRYLKHSLAYRTDGDPQIAYQDVIIT